MDIIIGIIPCVVIASLETNAFVAFVVFFDMLMVRSNLSARSRKEGTQGAVTILINEDAPVYVHDLDLFVTVRSLNETSLVLLLDILCLRHGYSFEWKIDETPRLTNNVKSINCTINNFVLLVVPRLSSIPAAFCLQHRDQQIRKVIPKNWNYYHIQSRLEVTSMHAGNRCGQIMTSRPRRTVNQPTRCARKIQRKAFLIGCTRHSKS